MNSRINTAEAALLMPFASRPSSKADEIAAIIAEARRARDAAFAERLRGFVRSIRNGLAAMMDRRRTIDALNSLSDRELADIGISRSGIPAAAAAVPSAANDHAEVRRAA
ncbi:DUF1127 domain-containing protein [Roseococcus sp. YIM B11640]|uniref:DUF1127 domain-containing protein n=1 Tax=Roseococcus sp. YIM B11640 TaxID=3133973 RepID=UPI003C7B3271